MLLAELPAVHAHFLLDRLLMVLEALLMPSHVIFGIFSTLAHDFPTGNSHFCR